VGADCRHSKRRPQEIVTAANQVPGLVGVFSLFNTRTPKVYADIDRVRAEMLGVTANRVFETLQGPHSQRRMMALEGSFRFSHSARSSSGIFVSASGYPRQR